MSRMIARLTGEIVEQNENSVIIKVGGIGYRIHTTPETAYSLKGVVDIFTHLVVRENAMDLYGFKTREEVGFFELLISVSGVGPRSAISILSTADLETLKNATASGDITYLTKVSGIGKKSAEKIVIELRDKIQGNGRTHNTEGEGEILDALKTLGYSVQEAREALKYIPDDVETQKERLKHALRALGR